MRLIAVTTFALFLAACSSTKPEDSAKSEAAKAAKEESKPAPPAPPAAEKVTLPAGTALVVRTTTAMSSDKVETGGAFAATLEQPLVINGKEIAPKGAEVAGRIAEADDGGRVKGLARLSLRLVSFTDGAGKPQDITTNTISRQARTTKKKDAAKIGIGAGIGAAIGAIAGGGKGAAIGAASGGAAGTGVVLATKGEQVRVPAESVLKFTLSAPLTVTLPR